MKTICATVQHLFTIALLLAATTAQADTVVVAYTATWCKYCQAIKPEIVQAQKDGFDIRLADVDDANTKRLPGFPSKIPAAVAIDSDTMKLVDSLPNARMNPAALRAFIAKHLVPKAPVRPTRPEKPKLSAKPMAYRSGAANPLKPDHFEKGSWPRKDGDRFVVTYVASMYDRGDGTFACAGGTWRVWDRCAWLPGETSKPIRIQPENRRSMLVADFRSPNHASRFIEWANAQEALGVEHALIATH